MASSSSSSSFSPSSSSSLLVSSHDHERPNIETIQAVVATINQYIYEFLEDTKTWKSVKLKCTSKLKIQKREFFEFSEQSILSNLYWGIESIEAAIQAKGPEEKSCKLKDSAQMLQIPASLSEHGVTAGISNWYMVCCSYFYLSVVQKLQRDDWQVALHFLHAVLVSPRLVRAQFVPKLCNSLFHSCMTYETTDMGTRRGLKSAVLMDFDDDGSSEAMKYMARRYKGWLTYYQVMSYGETPRWHSACRDTASADNELQSSMNLKSTGNESSNLQERGNSLLTYCHKINKIKPMQFEKVHPLDPQECITHTMAEESKVSDFMKFQEHIEALTSMDQVCNEELTSRSNTRSLQDLLKESQSDAPISENSCNGGSADQDEFEVYEDDSTTPKRTAINANDPHPEISDQKWMAPCTPSGSEYSKFLPQDPGILSHEEASIERITNFLSGRCYRSFSDLKLSVLEIRGLDSNNLRNFHVEEAISQRRLQQHDLQIFNHETFAGFRNYQFTQMDHRGSNRKSKHNPNSQKNPNEVCWYTGKDSDIELMGVLEKAISKLCFSERIGMNDEDYTAVFVKLYEMLSNKRGVKYTLLKDMIFDQLLTGISTSKEVEVIRASVSILVALILGNKAVIEDINKNGLKLCDLASALKRNVHEAAILIYLLNPPPEEIKTLELLPTLVEVVCTSNSYKGSLESLLPTPSVASLMIIEVLVTAFDYDTNSMHLAAIISPRVLSGFMDAPRNNNLEEMTSLATILVRCMQFDGQCRKYISKYTPVAPFISLLRSNQEQAKFVAVEFFHEILRMPRSSATNLLQQLQKEGSINIMNILLLLIQQSPSKYKLLAANLLLQLDILEDSPRKSAYKEEAAETLIKALNSEDNSAMQQLSAFLLSNIGGTYSWTGEPYTVAWLLKKTGLTTQHHRNMIRNFNWLDQSLQDSSTDTWCSKIARSVTKIGKPVFHALEKGLNSKKKKVSRDCLIATAWIGCSIARTPDNFRYTACENLLTAVEQCLHPGFALDERLLACLCIYNYASGKGMQKLIHFSEGVRESLRRLSGIAWMAEELLRVADYFLPNKWRISCVHTQILEASQSCSGAVTALTYYKGQLCGGYADGSIKLWDIEGQTTTLVFDTKEHKKAVTCFSLFEPGDCLLSGSADKTIRVWQMTQRKLECIEVIGMKEPTQSLDTCGQLIFAVTQSHEMKVFDASRTARDVCEANHVKCVRIIHGKPYVGCMDSSIQELALTNNQQREIKAPLKSWRIKSKPINTIAVYKDWLYSASALVEGSNIKEWRRRDKPQMSIVPEKGTNVLEMEVVEDFIYLNCSRERSILQIWLRGTQQKVGRLSAGSKITSLLTGNDIVLCGTETGVIKGWIPL